MYVPGGEHGQAFSPGPPGQKKPEEGKMKKGTYSGSKKCPICGVLSLRMDLHTSRVHKLTKGSAEYKQNLSASLVVRPETDDRPAEDLEAAIVDYG